MNAALVRLHAWDSAGCAVFNRVNHRRWGSACFGAISRLGDGVFWYAWMLALPAMEGWRGAALSAVLALNGLLCTALYRWLKGTTRRPRPCDVHAHLRRTVPPLDRFSFPSGHTLHAVAFTTLICLVHPVWAWLLVPFTALVAVSRLVLGLHYPSDVLAGAAIGASAAAGSWAVAAALGIV